MKNPLDQNAPPQSCCFLVYRWHSPKDFSSHNALDHLHDFRRAVHRHRLQQEVDMVLIRPDFQEHDFIPLRDVQAHIFQDYIYGFSQDSSTILRWTHRMIEKH
jgi:hypothetical protein